MLERLPGFGLSRDEKEKLVERMQTTVDITYEHVDMATHPITGTVDKGEDLQREMELIQKNPSLYVITALRHVSDAMDKHGIPSGRVDFRPPESRLGSSGNMGGVRRSDFRS